MIKVPKHSGDVLKHDSICLGLSKVRLTPKAFLLAIDILNHNIFRFPVSSSATFNISAHNNFESLLLHNHYPSFYFNMSGLQLHLPETLAYVCTAVVCCLLIENASK
jgi:hypothetical protein